ncbi:hypothetical protein [Lonomia obliqua multiple nucleopolyhedrovirus]|uniref:Uncharacterized protein n=1 Tax=Lonomia obliqua multiple nucleopolyhedrovirus TaxID=134394 RepID=A0A126FC59_9ABAC|nr:hypothetical protein [Lonomia obliqua multiple nucleopolyhedrovirus]AKN80987.1 hypothetical protein [Lonomia obliqua multiple nucleopolyhedrovirus]
MCQPSVILTKNDVYNEIINQNLASARILVGRHCTIMNCSNCFMSSTKKTPWLHVIIETDSDLFDLFIKLYYNAKNIFCDNCDSVSIFTCFTNQCNWRYIKRGYVKFCREYKHHPNFVHTDSDDSGYCSL